LTGSTERAGELNGKIEATAMRFNSLLTTATYDVRSSMVHAILGIRPPAARTAGRESHGRMDQPKKALADQELIFCCGLDD
jgi:hypothetical protein